MLARGGIAEHRDRHLVELHVLRARRRQLGDLLLVHLAEVGEELPRIGVDARVARSSLPRQKCMVDGAGIVTFGVAWVSGATNRNSSSVIAPPRLDLAVHVRRGEIDSWPCSSWNLNTASFTVRPSVQPTKFSQ